MRKINQNNYSGFDPNGLSVAQEKITEAIKRYPVRLVYLFGSYGRYLKGGRVTKYSDLDIAVLLDEGVNNQDILQLKLDLLDLLISIFKRDDVDLTLINQADYLLKHEILVSGYLLYVRQPEDRIEFEVATRKIYFDMKFMRDFHRQYFIEKVKRGEVDG